ncbi:hypothetical protein OG21DRAFT_1425153 [Imleria badia]|nr:hypothetical protein OG21DRAFT_1425153 [Imleria badia]
MCDISTISTIIQHHGIIYLDELQHELWAKHHKYATPSTLLRALQRLYVTQKVVSCAATERNEETRAIYMNCIAADVLDPNMLIFIDEAAKDKRMSTRQHGRLMKGVRCHVKRCFMRGTRF